MIKFLLVVSLWCFAYFSGWAACPTSIAAEDECLVRTEWEDTIYYSIKANITLRNATVIYNAINGSIVDAIDFEAEAIPTNYTANDFFTVYDVALNNAYQTEFYSIQYQFLLDLVEFYTTPTQIGATAAYESMVLKQFVATPLLVYNNAFGTGDGPTPAANHLLESILLIGYIVEVWFS